MMDEKELQIKEVKEERAYKRLKDLLLGACLGAALFAASFVFFTPVSTGESTRALPFSPQNLIILKEARTIIEHYHVDGNKNLGEQKLFYGSLRGLVDAVEDPYTRFTEPEQLKEETTEMEGEFGGLGIHIGQRDGKTLVISPMEGTPAEKVGLKPLDEIVKVEDKVIIGMEQNAVVKLLRGKPGTQVTIWVRRNGKGDLIKFTIIREIIKIKTVRFEVIKTPSKAKIAYIRLAQFNQKSAAEVKEAIQKAQKEQAIGIILDLRNNPGGLLNSAVDVASLFLDGGVVVGMRGRFERANDTLYAAPGIDTRLPLAVLINEGSASASEIVAGAIKDRERGVIVGKKSYGKGSVQTLFNLPEGAGIYVTIARYHTPNGTLIDHVGLKPNVTVEGEPSKDFAKDKPVQKAVELLIARNKQNAPAKKAAP